MCNNNREKRVISAAVQKHTRTHTCTQMHSPPVPEIIQHFHLRAGRAPWSPGARTKHLSSVYRQPPDVTALELASKIEVVLHFVILPWLAQSLGFMLLCDFVFVPVFFFAFLFIFIFLIALIDLHEGLVKHIKTCLSLFNT